MGEEEPFERGSGERGAAGLIRRGGDSTASEDHYRLGGCFVVSAVGKGGRRPAGICRFKRSQQPGGDRRKGKEIEQEHSGGEYPPERCSTPRERSGIFLKTCAAHEEESGAEQKHKESRREN